MTTMTLTPEQIIDICDTLDLDYLEDVHYEYSGRSMYGNTCLGFVVRDYSDTVTLGVAIAAALTRWVDDSDERENKLYEAQRIAQGARTDSMGLNTIVYFPRIQGEKP